MSAIDLEAIEARANAASRGPWEAYVGAHPSGAKICRPGFGDTIIGYRGYGIPAIEDAEFIAHARQDIPALIARIRELEAPSEIPNSSPPREWTLGWEQWVGVRAEEGPTLGRHETVRVREIQPNSSRGGER